ncbi:hypothetical protein B0H17DRAFT_1198082 [Mycena rosella]|uniref:Uncharacterized protein n=1 Tax=Mycena rosella TaxID=1033263 RepID=A0AAD7GMW0_MYCRO|nr:hypothetical protein B0H17DRAFT_1198082 [Mycena rosella]
MSKELPLKVRMDVRDLWDSSKSSVNDSVSALNKILGHTITPRVEWNVMWTDLKDRFPDNTIFVPTVVRYTIAWYERLSGRLENDAYEEWTEKFLDVLSDGSIRKALSLHIEPAGPGVTRPSTKWNAKLATFHLCVPQTEPVSQSKLDSSFDKDFENLFNTDIDAKDDDWADVEVETRTATVNPATISSPYEPPSVVRLPVLDALARPLELFTSTGPYILIVEERGGMIVVQCSHEPSLELLAAYLNKWSKSNPNDSDSLKRSILKVELVESEYCFGLMDTLTVERTMARNGNSINPTIILAFVEGVLGYKLTNTMGSCRTYASTTLLK